MKSVREDLGGLGNLLFKQAYLYGRLFQGKIPDVYVQSTRYWAAYKNEIQKILGTNIGFTNKIAIHIRRGDYLNTSFHTDLSKTNYYQHAIQHFSQHEQFLVFCKDNQGIDTDITDRKWCADFLDTFMEGRYEFAPIETTEVEDLNLMASCKSIVMANSSFSWWAAFLNPFQDKIVICPKAETWFTDGQVRCEPEEEWITI